MIDWIEELNERSKDDRAIIVGSEVRALVAEIERLRTRLAESEADFRTRDEQLTVARRESRKWEDAHAVLVIRALAAEAERDELLGALREVVEEWERDLDGAECCFPLYHRARAAIAKVSSKGDDK